MSGIGFGMRSVLARDSYLGLLRAYGVAGSISAGPWIVSILGVFGVGLFRNRPPGFEESLQQFQISVTYLMVFSYILTSPFQLPFTRFVGDRIFDGQGFRIPANLWGLLALIYLLTGAVAGPVLANLFEGSLAYRIQMLIGLLVLAGIWLTMSVLSAVQEHGKVLLAFLLGYGTSIEASYVLRNFGLEGLLGGYLLGQAVLFYIIVAVVTRRFQGTEPFSGDFLKAVRAFPKLALTGFLLATGVWADKFLFWSNPLTSTMVIKPLRASDVYDFPLFLAYLSIIPGMACFVLWIRRDFAERYGAFYASLNTGASLETISGLRDDMVESIRKALVDIFKIQGTTAAVFIASGEYLLRWAGISPLYRVLLNVDIVAVSVQVLLLAVFSVFTYLDEQNVLVGLALGFAVLNVGLTLVTQYLGPSYYGYGYAAALVITTLAGLIILSRSLNRLLYRTYMLQKSWI